MKKKVIMNNFKDLSIEEKLKEVSKVLIEFKSNGAAKRIKCDPQALISSIKALEELKQPVK
jgi:hypothetical protein